MAKILQKCVKYTLKELEQYSATDGSCVHKVTTEMHVSMGPYSLADFKHALHTHLVRTKVGIYDANLNGIILDIKNIKVLGANAAIRSDDPTIHLNIKADFYFFRPAAGVVISGVVKHVSKHQIGAIIYRVFNATIRFSHKLNKDDIQMNEEIKFRIKDFDLQNVFPYIEGEIILSKDQSETKFKKFDSSLSNEADSGIEERESTHGKSELDQLLTLIKNEPTSEAETTTAKKLKDKKKKRNISYTEIVPAELAATPTKKIKKEKVKDNVSDSMQSEAKTSKKEKKVKKEKIKEEQHTW